MKKLIGLICLITFSTSFAQDIVKSPQINVTGEGKLKVVPDQVSITLGVKNKSTSAKESKELTDKAIDKALKLLIKKGVNQTDIQTQRVSLYQSYDHKKKTTYYTADQTIKFLLTNLEIYDELMIELLNSGINTINQVQFKSSKFESFQSTVRNLAINNAKKKAQDYVKPLGQKVGKALMISESSVRNHYPEPIMYESMAKSNAYQESPHQTLATGEIEISIKVSVRFILL